MNRNKEEQVENKLRNVTQEQYECIVANHTDLNVYPMTSKGTVFLATKQNKKIAKVIQSNRRERCAASTSKRHLSKNEGSV